MRLSSLIHAEWVVLGLESRTLADAVPELLDKAHDFRPAIDKAEIVKAVMHRESQASTATEKGLAIPHARVAGLRDFYILIGRPAVPLEDKGLDGQPVNLIFLILSDNQKNALMLQSMAGLGRLSMQDDTLEHLRQAGKPDEVLRILDESRITVKKTIQARDLMKECPFTATPGMHLQELLDLMFEHQVRAAPVCDEDCHVVGGVSSGEILEAGFPDYMDRIPDISFLPEFEAFEQFFRREETICVRDVMNPEPLVLDAEDPLIQIVFGLRRARCPFAFVERDGELAGMVDRDDIISRILRA